jgi:TolB-like protein
VSKAEVKIDWHRGVVSDGSGVSTPLRAQSLAVLRELYDRAGTLVSKDELIAKVWAGLAVTDDSIVQCIADLRRALKDDDHAIIKTITKRGYLLEKSFFDRAESDAEAPNHQTALKIIDRATQQVDKPVQKSSIAVLPFVNLSADTGQDYFADGLTEDVITDLSNVPGLFVIARNSSFAYKGKAQNIKQIALDLGVRYVLEGSIRKSAQRLRITVQLSDAETGLHVWAERFDRELGDTFSLEDELTAKIVANLVGKIHEPLPERPVHRNLRAYDLLLKGRALLRSGRYAETVRFLALDYEANDLLRPYMAVALHRLGRADEAAAQIRIFLELTPDWQAGDYVNKRGFRDQGEADWWMAAFCEAGLPE